VSFTEVVKSWPAEIEAAAQIDEVQLGPSRLISHKTMSKETTQSEYSTETVEENVCDLQSGSNIPSVSSDSKSDEVVLKSCISSQQEIVIQTFSNTLGI